MFTKLKTFQDKIVLLMPLKEMIIARNKQTGLIRQLKAIFLRQSMKVLWIMAEI